MYSGLEIRYLRQPSSTILTIGQRLPIQSNQFQNVGRIFALLKMTKIYTSWDFSSSGLTGHHWRLHRGRQHPGEMVSKELSTLHCFNMISIKCCCFQLFAMVDKRSKMFNHLITFWLSNMDQCASIMKTLKPIFSSLLTKKDFSLKSRSINHPPVIVSSDWVILAPLLLSFLSLTMLSLLRSEISSGFLENVTFCATPTTSCMSWWDHSERRIQFVVHQLLCRLWWQFIRCTKLQALIWWVWLFFYLAQILGLILSPSKVWMSDSSSCSGVPSLL